MMAGVFGPTFSKDPVKMQEQLKQMYFSTPFSSSDSPQESFGNIPSPVGNANRNLLGQLFDPNAIAREDWARSQQADMLSFERNADLTREMARNEYLYKVEGMKKAGINPVMALNSLGGSSPVVGGSSSGGSGYGENSAGSNLLSFIGKIASGLITGDFKLSALEFANALADQSSEAADARRHGYKMDEIRLWKSGNNNNGGRRRR